MDTSTAEKLIALLQETNARQAAENENLKIEVQWLKEQLGLLRHRVFGPSSERSLSGQEPLDFGGIEAVLPPSEPEMETVTITRRKRIGRRAEQVRNLRVEQIHHRLSPEDRVCPKCDGRMFHMGVEIRREEVRFVPAEYVLTQHVCHKYSCRYCDANATSTPIVTSPMPEAAFPKSLASPSLVAGIICAKYVEGMPLYRQEKHLARRGIDFSRQTMANWVIAGSHWLRCIYVLMCARLLKSGVMHSDDTEMQVLHEDGKTAQSKSYMWLYRSGRYGPPIVVFEYKPSRHGSHPSEFLKNYKGYLHTDGYSGYDGLPPDIILAGCWSHARRKFDEALMLIKPEHRSKPDCLARIGFEYCNALFMIERDLYHATPEERHAIRLVRSREVLDNFRIWLDKQASMVLKKCALGVAITYCRRQWTKLTAFLLDGRLEISNNRAENAIRPVVIGRKNYLFANAVSGANASAMLYSIIETAKANELDPFTYLTYLFEQIPNINQRDTAAVEALLPWAAPVQATCHVPSSSASATPAAFTPAATRAIPCAPAVAAAA